MIRSALRTQVENIISRDDKTDLINSALDMALEEISMRHYFLDMYSESDLTTVAAQAYVDLPSNTHKLMEARFIDSTQSYPLDIRNKRWLTQYFPNISADSNMKCKWGHVEDDKLYLYPVPDDAYTIRVTVLKLMQNLASDAASPETNGIDRVIIAFAAHWVFEALEQYESAAKWLIKFERMLERAVRDDEKRLAENRIFTGFQGDMMVFPSDYYNDPFFKYPPRVR